MLISMEEARETLRLDGTDNDIIIQPLVEAIPSYLEVATGKDWTKEPDNRLAQTTAKFILQLWYEPEDANSAALKRTIDTLLTALTALGRKR